MTSVSPIVRNIIWGLLLAVIGVVSLLYFLRDAEDVGPPLPVYGNLTDFALTNQIQERVTLARLEGKPWVANIIFTRCPGPCAKMTQQMKRLQGLSGGMPVMFVSLTADPRYDSPAVLRQYGERFGVDQSNWWFLTGQPSEVYRVATNDLKFTVFETDPATRAPDEDPFIHSTKFAVIDHRGRLRAFYDGELPEAPAQIFAALRRLRKESSR